MIDPGQVGISTSAATWLGLGTLSGWGMCRAFAMFTVGADLLPVACGQTVHICSTRTKAWGFGPALRFFSALTAWQYLETSGDLFRT